MLTHKELLAKKILLDQQIRVMYAHARSTAIEQARRLIDQYEILEEDVFRPKRVMPYSYINGYRDPKSGRVWSGEGPAPKWLGSMKSGM
jgi:DNA-binding protein H-NS